MSRWKPWNKTAIINNKKESQYGKIITIIRPHRQILKVIKIKCSPHNQSKYIVKSVDKIATMKKKIVHTSNVIVYVISVYFVFRYISKKES